MGIRATRAVRGTALAAFATLIAALAHTLGGGTAPSPLFCATVFALAAPVATALSAAATSLWRTAVAVGASQVLFHGAFSTLGDFGAWAPISTGHVHGAVLPALSGTPALGAHVDMTLAHVVAALVTVAVARRGENVIARIRGWILRRATPLPAAQLPRAAPRPLPHRCAPLLPLGVDLGGLSRRGPPVFLSNPSAA